MERGGIDAFRGRAWSEVMAGVRVTGRGQSHGSDPACRWFSNWPSGAVCREEVFSVGEPATKVRIRDGGGVREIIALGLDP